MAARPKARTRPIDAATARLMALAARGMAPSRMAREVEVIANEWLKAEDAEPSEVKERLAELHEQLVAGVGDAQEQLADADASDAAALRHAQGTLDALLATRDAAQRALAAI